MSDTEYKHPIWINDRVLSHEFHYAWSILAFGDTWISGRHQRTAMRFHYASLTPIELENRWVSGLGMHLIKNPNVVRSWYKRYAGELGSMSCDDLIRNLNSDSEILIEEAAVDKVGFSSVYRKSLPGGMITNLEKTISGIEKYLSKQE